MSDSKTVVAGNGESAAYRSFEDLEVYKSAREFRKQMYIVAKRLPDFEKFGLASQIRRAAAALTNNLAEGHGRFLYLDQIKFVLSARGSLEELIDDLNICQDEAYLPAQPGADLKTAAWQVLKLINGYLRYLRDRKLGGALGLREEPAAYPSGAEESMEWIETLLERHPEIEPIAKHHPHH